MALSREAAILWLTDRNLLTKAPEHYSTAYLRRAASSFSKIDAGGAIDWSNPKHVKYARDLARGHPQTIPSHHLPKEGRRLNQQYLPNPVMVRDIGTMLKNAPDAPKYLLLITGYPKEGSPTDKKFNPERETTYSTDVSRAQLVSYTSKHPYGSLIDFANAFIPKVEWQGVTAISLAIPEAKGKNR
jgi:hypothetical protein